MSKQQACLNLSKALVDYAATCVAEGDATTPPEAAECAFCFVGGWIHSQGISFERLHEIIDDSEDELRAGVMN